MTSFRRCKIFFHNYFTLHVDAVDVYPFIGLVALI